MDSDEEVIKMPTWKKGKTFKKGKRTVRYIYPNGKKRGKKLVTVKSGSRRFGRSPARRYNRRRRY